MAFDGSSLGEYVEQLMRERGLSNRALANQAGISEFVIRNMLKHGIDRKAKDPDARSLRRVADALGVNALYLFRLAGYIPPAPDGNSARAEYLADIFDELPKEKQDAIMSVLEAMTDKIGAKLDIREMRKDIAHPFAGIDSAYPSFLRDFANGLIAQHQMTHAADVRLISPDATVNGVVWKSIPQYIHQRIIGLIRAKLALDYDPTMVDPEWRK